MIEGVHRFLSEHMIDVPKQCMKINSSRLSFGPSTFFTTNNSDKTKKEEKGVGLCELTDRRWKQVVNASKYVGRIFFENRDQEPRDQNSRRAERYCATCVLVAPQLVITSKYALPNHRVNSIYAIFSIYGNPFTAHRFQLEEVTVSADDDFIFYKLKETPLLNTPLDQFLKISSVNTEDRDNLFLIGYPAFMDEECSSCISRDVDERKMKESMKSYETKVAIRLDQNDQPHVINDHLFSQIENHGGLNQMTGTCGFGIFKLHDSEVNLVQCCGIILHGKIAKRVDHIVQRNYNELSSSFQIQRVSDYNEYREISERMKEKEPRSLSSQVQHIKHVLDRIKPVSQYQLESPDHIQFSDPDLKLSVAVHKIDVVDKEELERELSQIDQDEIEIEQEIGDVHEGQVVPLSDRDINESVSFMNSEMSKQKSRISEQNAEIQALRFDAYFGNESTSKPYESCTPIFNQRTTMYPLEFTTRIVLQNSTDPQKKEREVDIDSSKIYTHIEPVATVWRNIDDGQLYIQLMGHVTYGWNLELGAPWTEATGVTVSIKPVTEGTCFLLMESVSSQAVLEIKHGIKHANLTTSHSTEKGFTGNLGLELGGGPTGGTVKLPSIMINNNEGDQQQATARGIDVHKIEFERCCQAPSHRELKWSFERKYSRIKNRALGTPDLELFDPKIERLSKKEFQKLFLESDAQKLSDHTNFGVWKWDGQNVKFVFHVQHGFRHVEKKHSIGRNYKAKHMKLSGPTLEFPIELHF